VLCSAPASMRGDGETASLVQRCHRVRVVMLLYAGSGCGHVGRPSIDAAVTSAVVLSMRVRRCCDRSAWSCCRMAPGCGAPKSTGFL